MIEWDILRPYLPLLIQGTIRTVELTLLSLLGGLLIAVPMAAMRNAASAALRGIALAYVFFFRGTPLLALLFMIYYGVPELDVVRDSWAWAILREPWACAVLALSLNSAGYLTEIFAGAARNVPKEELEAARAAGLPLSTRLVHITVPHTMRLALRSYGNEVVFVVKGTAVASLVTIIELLGAARQIYSNTFDPITPFGIAALIYLAFVFLVLRLIATAERLLTPELRVRSRRERPAGAILRRPSVQDR